MLAILWESHVPYEIRYALKRLCQVMVTFVWGSLRIEDRCPLHYLIEPPEHQGLALAFLNQIPIQVT